MLIALGTADQYRTVQENLFSKWDMLSLPSVCASDLHPRAGDPSPVHHSHLLTAMAMANEEERVCDGLWCECAG